MGCKKCAEGICGCSKRAETDMVEVPIKVVAVKDGDWNEYEGKMSIWDDGSLDEYELEEQIRSSIEEGDYEILDVGDEDWDELDVTWVGHPVWESLKHSYEAEEPAVQEPDWIPDGDGRAIGQQNFGINLSPLHAETTGQPTRLVVAIDTSGSTGMDYKGRGHGGFGKGFGHQPYPLLKKYETMARQMAKTMNTDEFIILDWNGQGVTHGPRHGGDSLTAYNGTGSIGMIGEWLQEHDVLTGGEYIDTVVIITDGVVREFTHKNAESFNAEGEIEGASRRKVDGGIMWNGEPMRCFYCGNDAVYAKGVASDPEFYCRNHVRRSKKGLLLVADTVGTPSPTFNEDITGQDGPSDSPTNSNFSAETQTFEAMRTLAPSTRDVDSARTMLKNSGYGDVIYDRYIVNQQGSSNKFYYTAITEKDGKYFPMGAYGRIGYLGRLFNVAGKKERPFASFGSMELAYRQIKEKEDSKINARKTEKRYVDYTLTRGAESLEEIEGPTAEATTGGLHAPSSFAMTWEDGTGQSSASIPPNEIAWADTKGIPTWAKWGAGIALVLAGGKVLSARMSEQKAENNLKSVVNARKGCCGGSKTVRKDSEFSVGQINPVEVEGQSDVYGAEELHSPQTSAKVSQPNWGPQKTYRQNSRRNLKMW